MKLVRLTDDRWLLDLGERATAAMVDEVSQKWHEWWKTNTEPPNVFVVGGYTFPIEYEDRREPDIESRLRALEERTGLR